MASLHPSKILRRLTVDNRPYNALGRTGLRPPVAPVLRPCSSSSNSRPRLPQPARPQIHGRPGGSNGSQTPLERYLPGATNPPEAALSVRRVGSVLSFSGDDRRHPISGPSDSVPTLRAASLLPSRFLRRLTSDHRPRGTLRRSGPLLPVAPTLRPGSSSFKSRPRLLQSMRP